MKKVFAGMCLGIAAISAAHAEVTVKDAWVRATVAHQHATGAFMQLTSSSDARLLEVQTPVAGIAEVHEMKMENNVMKMRAVDALELPAGKTVELKPGSFHIMLMNLKNPVNEGDEIPLTLILEDKNKKREKLELKLKARGMMAGHAHM